MNDVLKDYTQFDFSDGRWTRPVYRRGSGPAVIVIHEMPNMHPLVVRFGNHVAEAGMTAILPSLFGDPGRAPTPLYGLGQMLKGICIRREFDVWSTDKSSPIVDCCARWRARSMANAAARASARSACASPGISRSR